MRMLAALFSGRSVKNSSQPSRFAVQTAFAVRYRYAVRFLSMLLPYAKHLACFIFLSSLPAVLSAYFAGRQIGCGRTATPGHPAGFSKGECGRVQGSWLYAVRPVENTQ